MVGGCVLTLGITGTDTGVGKTTVACAMLAMLGERGIRTAAMKPVETGVAEGDLRSDALRLRSLATVVHPMHNIRPYRFDPPLAPMVAAELAGKPIVDGELDRAFHRLQSSAEVTIVEGAGGALVPLSESVSMADLFRRWALDVIIVAVNRLGVLNHVLLTERALRAAGCPVVGIVLVESERADEASALNAPTLSRLTSTPLFNFPWMANPFDVRALADAARRARLDALLPGVSPSTVVTR
jgi:dethiobiotin synthetase